MQNSTNNDINQKEDHLAELAKLKKRYKEKKEILEWAEDEWEESIIEKDMGKLASMIRELTQKIASTDTTEKSA